VKPWGSVRRGRKFLSRVSFQYSVATLLDKGRLGVDAPLSSWRASATRRGVVMMFKLRSQTGRAMTR
jgi:hypothetical protein